MNKLKIGDRVRVYGNSQMGEDVNGLSGSVRSLLGEGWFEVNFSEYRIHAVHHKQCRKLKKKEKTEFLGYGRLQEDSMYIGHLYDNISDCPMARAMNDDCVYKIYGIKAK